MRKAIIFIILFMFAMSCYSFTVEEFKNVGVGDTIFLDFTKYRMNSITGKVIDIVAGDFKTGIKDSVVIYEVRMDGSWSATRWHYYWITSIVSKATNQTNDDLIKENMRLKEKIVMLITELKRLIGLVE